MYHHLLRPELIPFSTKGSCAAFHFLFARSVSIMAPSSFELDVISAQFSINPVAAGSQLKILVDLLERVITFSPPGFFCNEIFSNEEDW